MKLHHILYVLGGVAAVAVALKKKTKQKTKRMGPVLTREVLDKQINAVMQKGLTIEKPMLLLSETQADALKKLQDDARREQRIINGDLDLADPDDYKLWQYRFFIMYHWEQFSDAMMSKEVGLPVNAVKRIRFAFGLYRKGEKPKPKGSKRRWTEKELKLLQSDAPAKELARQFGRSTESVHMKKCRLRKEQG